MAMANREMVSMVLVRRGDEDNGAIFVRLDLPQGQAKIEQRILNFDGDYEWISVSDEALSIEEAERYCQRQTDIDPDCWIVAIDSTIGDNPLKKL